MSRAAGLFRIAVFALAATGMGACLPATSTSPVDTGTLASGTVTGNPKPAPATVAIQIGGNSNGSISSLQLCPQSVTFFPATGQPIQASLNLSDTSVVSDYTELGTVSVPVQTYTQVSLALGSSCASGQSIALTNDNGSFKSSGAVTLTFVGVFVPSSTTAVELQFQLIVDQLAAVSANAQLQMAAQTSTGSVNAASSSGGSSGSIAPTVPCSCPGLSGYTPGLPYTCAPEGFSGAQPSATFYVMGTSWTDSACTVPLSGSYQLTAVTQSGTVPSSVPFASGSFDLEMGLSCAPDGNGAFVVVGPLTSWLEGSCFWQAPSSQACLAAGCR